MLNIHKTRLNDPYMWFMGTNDQPGDYRHSGCAGCHVVYANDRQPQHSLTYAPYGRDGQSATIDPTIPSLNQAAPADPNHAALAERGHPIRHVFTRAIPTSQCMTCHMHQPNIFLNTYLGYTMWDYESDADLMWPGPENRLPARNAEEERRFRSQHFPTAAETREVLDRNPEAAAARGLWSDPDFVREVYDRVNPLARTTQFADYHGHGWNFRGIYRRDRAGNLLDADGHIIPPGDPQTFRRAGESEFAPPGTNPGRAVHMMDIHAERGLQCADCHFSQDRARQWLHLWRGRQCDRDRLPRLPRQRARLCQFAQPPAPAAPPHGTDLSLIRNEDGRRRFEWVERGGRRILIQRSIVDPSLEWEVSQVRDSVNPDLPPCEAAGDQPTPGPCFNLRSARAKLMARSGAETGRYVFGLGVARPRPRPSRQRDRLLHLPPFMDDELRRLPFADRGQQPHLLPPL